MRQIIYIEFNPSVEPKGHTLGHSTPYNSAAIYYQEPNDLPSLVWRKNAIDDSLRTAIESIHQQGKAPLDVVIGGMYVLKNVTCIIDIRVDEGMPGFLRIEFEQAVRYG